MKYLLPVLVFSFFILSCTDNSVSNRNAFSIISCQKLDAQSGDFAKIKLTVKNNANFTGGCWAYIKIKKAGVIIETSSIVFSSLKPGESQIEEAWFNRFDKHSEYDRAEVTLNWNVDSTNYKREYSY